MHLFLKSLVHLRKWFVTEVKVKTNQDSSFKTLIYKMYFKTKLEAVDTV